MLKAWYGGAWWLFLLRPLEALFRLISKQRYSLYNSGTRGTYRAPVPVVVVGNITVGGTGKTPVVIALVEHLQAQGLSVGVVSRGFGADNTRKPQRVADDSNPEQCGDEPLLIYRRTGAPCVVAASRAKAVRELLSMNEIDVVISDDGLQHYALERDLEIAVLDARRGIGNGFCLPAGPLREPASRLWTVDFLLYRHGQNRETAVQYTADALVNLVTGEQRTADAEALESGVHAVTGLGQPDQFFAMLRLLGFAPVEHAFVDHHRFSPKDFEGLADMPIIMTEKDALKCAHLAGNNAWYLKISAQIPCAVSQAVTELAQR